MAVGIPICLGLFALMRHPPRAEDAFETETRGQHPEVSGRGDLPGQQGRRGEGSGATGNGTRQAGPERELSRFSYYYCHLLLSYHYYTLPSLCLCIFPFGHNWGLFLFIDYAALF